jgi:hypothetical protein
LDPVYQVFRKLAQDDVRNICEIGFNAGHSALNWLTASPHTKVFAFDIGHHHYTAHGFEFLRQLFPRRLQLTMGDSTDTVPTFAKLNPGLKCDLLLIDGGHLLETARADLLNFRAIANMTR